jgi:hypothetical protein
MEALGVLGFIFGLLGVVAYTRIDKLEKRLKEAGILDEDFKSE